MWIPGETWIKLNGNCGVALRPIMKGYEMGTNARILITLEKE